MKCSDVGSKMVLEAFRVFFHSPFVLASLPKTSLSGSNNKGEKSIVDLPFYFVTRSTASFQLMPQQCSLSKANVIETVITIARFPRHNNRFHYVIVVKISGNSGHSYRLRKFVRESCFGFRRRVIHSCSTFDVIDFDNEAEEGRSCLSNSKNVE